MSEVRVFARMKAKESKEQQVRTILLDLVKASRTEDGTDFYELFETTDGGEFLFSEQYSSAEDFESHKSSDHFKQALEVVGPLLDEEAVIWVVDPVEPVL